MNLITKTLLSLCATLGVVGCTDSGEERTITAHDLGAGELTLDALDGRIYTFSPADGALDTTRIRIGSAPLELLVAPVVSSPVLRDVTVTVETSVEDDRYRFVVAYAVVLPDGVVARPNTGGGGTCDRWVQYWLCTDTDESHCELQTECASWR